MRSSQFAVSTRLHKVFRSACLLVLVFLAGVGCESTPGRLGRIKESGILRVAIDPSFPPFEYIDEQGQLRGLDADLAQELARRLGVQAHFVTTTYDGLYDALITDHADVIISALYPDFTQTEDFAFSSAYFNAGTIIAVLQNSPVQTRTDLAGRRVAVIFGTEGHMEAMRLEQTLASPPVILQYESADAVLSALHYGQVEAAILDNIAARMAQNNGQPLSILSPPLTDESYVVAVRKEDRALLEALNRELDAMRTDGTLDALVARWLR